MWLCLTFAVVKATQVLGDRVLLLREIGATFNIAAWRGGPSFFKINYLVLWTPEIKKTGQSGKKIPYQILWKKIYANNTFWKKLFRKSVEIIWSHFLKKINLAGLCHLFHTTINPLHASDAICEHKNNLLFINSYNCTHALIFLKTKNCNKYQTQNSVSDSNLYFRHLRSSQSWDEQMSK